MDEPYKKLLLNTNTPIKKRQTLFSINQKKNSFNSLINITNNKQKYAFQSLVKQYGNSIIRNSQIDSVNDKRRIAKTPKNFMFKKGDKKNVLMKRAKTLQTLKKCESATNESFEKSEFFMGQKIDMELLNINISILASYFKSIYPDQVRMKKFCDEFKDRDIEGYEEILLLMKEFKDFNIFDYLNISHNPNSFFLTKEKLEERNRNICKRNNIILSLLIEHEYLKEKEEKGIVVYRKNMKMFDRTEFLFPLLENFKAILVNLKHDEIAFEVEVLIFALLDYYEYAQYIYHCHIKYFNDFLNKIGLKD